MCVPKAISPQGADQRLDAAKASPAPPETGSPAQNHSANEETEDQGHAPADPGLANEETESQRPRTLEMEAGLQSKASEGEGLASSNEGVGSELWEETEQEASLTGGLQRDGPDDTEEREEPHDTPEVGSNDTEERDGSQREEPQMEESGVIGQGEGTAESCEGAGPVTEDSEGRPVGEHVTCDSEGSGQQAALNSAVSLTSELVELPEAGLEQAAEALCQSGLQPLEGSEESVHRTALDKQQ